MELKRLLVLGSQGDDVKELQKILSSEYGSILPVDGVFGQRTLSAVKAFQISNNLEVDGIVGHKTWNALNLREKIPFIPGDKQYDITHGFNSQDFADFCFNECSKKLLWTPDSEARKYTKAFESWFGTRRFEWCGATVHWQLNEYLFKPQGKEFPIKFKKDTYTFALVEEWQLWAKELEFHKPNDGSYEARPGDICIFDWNRKSLHEPDTDWDDHIGVVIKNNGSTFTTAEGNVNNRTGIFERPNFLIESFVVIPEGWKG